MKRKRKTGRKLLGILLSLALVLGLMPAMSLTAYAEEETVTVTWKNTDFSGQTNTKDGVTINSPGVVNNKGREVEIGKYTSNWTFTSSIGDFQEIVVSGGWRGFFGTSGEGWSGDTWTGNFSSVSAYGVITDSNGSSPWTITFKIKRVNVTGVTLDPTSATLTVGGTETLTATVAPEDATNKSVTWASDNTDVATVDESGLVTAVAAGTATITATATNGTDDTNDDETATCAVTVNPVTYTVTYKVANGTWSDGSTEDKTETVQSGLKPAGVPTDMKALEGYTGGAWDVDPAEKEITEAATFTYTFTAKQAASITQAPETKTLTYNGSAQELVTAGEASGGTMQYALGTKDAATGEYSADIPTATDAGTYYVWYRAVGDDTHTDSEPASVTVTVAEKEEVEEIKYYVEVPLTTGKVKDITGTEEAPAETNPYGTKIVNSESLETLLEVSDAEKTAGVNVWLDVQDGTATVPETDKSIILSNAGDYEVGQYLDINLFKKVGDNDPVKVSETNGKVKVSIVIPASLRKDGRTFRILKVHNGEPSVIDGTYDASTSIFTFETDSFSSYAIAYKDGEEEDDDDDDDDEPAQVTPVVTTTEPRSPKTGDDMMGYSFWLMLAAAGLAVSGMAAKGRKEQE